MSKKLLSSSKIDKNKNLTNSNDYNTLDTHVNLQTNGVPNSIVKIPNKIIPASKN